MLFRQPRFLISFFKKSYKNVGVATTAGAVVPATVCVEPVGMLNSSTRPRSPAAALSPHNARPEAPFWRCRSSFAPTLQPGIRRCNLPSTQPFKRHVRIPLLRGLLQYPTSELIFRPQVGRWSARLPATTRLGHVVRIVTGYDSGSDDFIYQQKRR